MCNKNIISSNFEDWIFYSPKAKKMGESLDPNDGPQNNVYDADV